ncbi:MAG: tRNA (adenosine(37)-N6)-dimethylallyltransferase MiaA [Robiginitomaculum sp.]
MSLMNQIACIAGPTASGKSAMAIKLAKKIGGEVINADALQVYSDLRILSARPSAAEEASVPHHLFGHIDPSVRYSVGQWLGEVEPVIIDVLARGRVPIVIGGTGLYFKALTQGLAKVPAPSEAGKREAAALLERGIEPLQAAAARLDPLAFARILGKDPQRLLRLTEVALGTDKPLSAWQAATRPLIPRGYWQGMVLLPEREGLYGRINARFDQMASNGGMEEAARISALGLDPMLPAMKAIGLRELMAVNSGDMTMEEGLGHAKRETRRFAKRQYTWFRGQAKDWPVAVTDAEREGFAAMLHRV